MMMSLVNSLLNSKTMHRASLLPLIVALLLTTSTCNAKCVPSFCGDIQNISYPFRLKGDPNDCGNPMYELACENNRTILYFYNSRYYVRSITYNNSGVLRLVYDGLQKDEASSLPQNTRTSFDFPWYLTTYSSVVVSILNCSKRVSSRSYVTATESCIKAVRNSSSNLSQTKNYYLYMLLSANTSDVEDSCTIRTTVPVRHLRAGDEISHPTSCDRIHNMMMYEFDVSISLLGQYKKVFFLCFFGLQYISRYQPWCGDYYYDPAYESVGSVVARISEVIFGDFIIFSAYFVAAKFIIGSPFVLIFLIYKWRRRHLAMDVKIEEFLQANDNFLPIRYSYSDVKKITKNFKHKLGEGGYGIVYQGKLRSGIEVAIKVLKKSKRSDQEFISEVATIGRIYHVNVVQLIGFCIEGSKQALVYHFMPNGSLDKHIFSKVGGTLLDCKKIYEIALGIARGMEYLHRGCDMQILHFDIKPHNILLDENFTPKISDFGLARLYPTDRSIVSLTAVRGTLGYMAPEFFYRDIGGVSYKADVYSFGRMLMEMVGRRRNINANTEHSSQVYFPIWIYDHLNEGEDELEELLEEEHEMTRKMLVVALWCIQLNPINRPSMKRVINMLEGNIAQLQIPPKPLLYPSNPMPATGNEGTEIELESFSSSSSTPIISASLRLEDTSELWEASTS